MTDNLFAWARATAAGDPETSAVAERQHTASGARSRQALATLALVRRYPGRTACELHAEQGQDGELTRSAISRRMADLQHAKMVRVAGRRICSVAGTWQSIWEAVP